MEIKIKFNGDMPHDILVIAVAHVSKSNSSRFENGGIYPIVYNETYGCYGIIDNTYNMETPYFSAIGIKYIISLLKREGVEFKLFEIKHSDYYDNILEIIYS